MRICNECFPVTSCMKDIVNDHLIAFDEVDGNCLAFVGENSEAFFNIIARRPTL